MTSMIPRPFSPMDALRAEQENAREAERRTSARNASNSKIGAGGSLELAGGIKVLDGGNIDVNDGGNVNVIGTGVVRVTSEIQDFNGVPFTIEAKLGNSQDPGFGGIPALVFRNDVLAQNVFSSLSSIQGFDLTGRAEHGDSSAYFGINAEPGYTASSLAASGGETQPGYSVVRVTPGGFTIQANDGDGNRIGHVQTAGPNSPLKIGPKGLDVEGPLTNNGAPVGGTPAWADITGKPASYPPSNHSHPISEVTDLQTQLDAKSDKPGAWALLSVTTGTPLGGDRAAIRREADGASLRFSGGILFNMAVPAGTTMGITPANLRVASIKNMVVASSLGVIAISFMPDGRVLSNEAGRNFPSGGWIDFGSIAAIPTNGPT